MIHHRRGLRRLLQDDDLLTRIELNWETAGLDARTTALLRYAVKLTREPAQVSEDDIEQLRATGLSDRDILDLCEVTAYYAYVNRIAAGLGVGIEDWGPDE